MAAGSRIAVEVAGNAASLQEAVDKAAASLRGLAETVMKTSAASIASGDRIIASNAELAKSYASSATAAEASSTRSVAAAAKMDAGFGAAHSSITKLGKDVTLALVGVAAGSVYAGVKFQDATASIAKNAGISTAAATKIGDAFLSTAFKSVFSAAQLSSAFGSVAGQLKLTEGHALTASEALKVMAASGDLAEATNETLATTTSALANVMQAYHLKVGQAAAASDLLFNLSKSLAVPVESISGAFDKLHARLGVLVPSMKDLGGLMISFAEQGQTGSRGILLANTAITTLTAGSKATSAMLKELGVNVFDSQGKFIGLSAVIGDLRPKLAGLTEQSQELALKALFGSGAWQIMGQIIGAGVPKFQAATDAASKLGTAHAAALIQEKQLQSQWLTLVHGMEDYAVKISQKVIPALQAMIQWIVGAVGWLDKHKAAAAALAVTIGAVLGGAVANFAYTKAVVFTTAIKGMVTQLGLLATKMLTTVGIMGGAETEMVAGAEETATAVDGAMLATGVGAALVALGVAAYLLESHWKTVMSAMASAARTMANGVVDSLNWMIGIFNSTIGQITGNIGKLGQFSSGGGGVGTAPSAAAQGAVAQSQKNLAAIVGGASTGFTSQSSFDTNLLKALGAKATAGNVAALNAWANAEKPWGTGPDKNNPLDITIAPGVSTNSAGVKAIPTSQQGLYATAQFILQRTPGILDALRAGTTPAGLSAAVTASGWGTGPFGGGGITPPVGGGGGLPTGSGTVVSSTAPKAPATSFHYDWRTHTYHLMTAAQVKQMQDQWYAQNSGRPMPTSPAKATATSQAAAAYAITGNTLPGLDTALTRISTAQTKAGDTTLGGLTGAVQSGTLSGLNSQLSYVHTQAMNKLVVGLLEVHTKANEKLALQIVNEYQKALKEQTALVKAAQLKAAQVALGQAVTTAAAAFNRQSTTLGTLFGAGATLGLPGQDAVTGGLAQEVPLTGSLTGSSLAPVLATLIPQLEAGMSKGQLTTAAGEFGPNSELGTLFGGLASGNLNATDTASSYDTIYSLIGGLATLQTTVGANTNALADNTATMVSLLQQQNTILSEKVALGAAQGSVLRNYIPNLPHMASGGPVIDDGLIYAHAGEHVVPQGGSLVMGGGQQTMHLHQTVTGEMAPLLSLIDSRVSHPDNVLKISRQIGRRTSALSGAPGGWR
jgi:TP901 family phage tail tape measure protein